ncbi:sortase [Paenibacillus sp. MMS20-IR301]|uniref:sortase n=1 Tax=Paenibacillus sp. MMS20-IR301 TaxID=2895946 RepID=UPI0028EAFA84|nr:sortase [Paenibacillus sp. MMS20-IR301]WNS42473.1 sortase [Paenibacillus sp. MMS20-IR301]
MKRHSGIAMAVKLIFILSLCVMLYSAVQIFKAPAEAREALNTWEKKREEAVSASLPPAAVDEMPLPEGMLADAAGAVSAGSSYTKGEVLGEIYIPKLDKRVAVLEGTGKAELKKGAGHDLSSAAVGAAGNSVLAGHRDTVFRGLGELEEQDIIEVETADGKFIYEVTGSTIVDGEARGAIKPSSEPVLTLITCYPFSYVGSAPDRYLLSARLISSEPLEFEP